MCIVNVGFHTASILQGTKACLGWDREASDGTSACTATTDLWLCLLEIAAHAVRALQHLPLAQGAASHLPWTLEAPPVSYIYLQL